LYFIYLDEYYKKYDKAFIRREFSKEVYWTKMVKITIKVMDNFYNKVNAFLKIKNDTFYLKIVYEKVLFSICFIDKKKYFKVLYKEIINFKPKKLFIKSFNIIK